MSMNRSFFIFFLTSLLSGVVLPAKDLKLINELPARLARANKEAHKGWDTGNNGVMKEASYKFNEELMAIIKELVAAYYPKDQISEENITDYLKALYTTNRFKQNAGNPSGESQGTMAGLLVLGHVTAELEKTISEMVGAIVEDEAKFDFKAWKMKWEKADKEQK